VLLSSIDVYRAYELLLAGQGGEPVPPAAKRIRVTVSTLWEAAWAELDIPGRADSAV
jgi:hypothetical protein